MTDSATLTKAIAGDRDACAALVSAYYPACIRVATRMLRHHADAEDVVQDTFLRAIRALPRYNLDIPFRAWLFHILLNQCRTQGKRRSQQHQRMVNDPEAIHRHVAASNPAANAGDLERIHDAIDQLDPPLREAFLLKYVEELEYSEMAIITGASISALKMRAKRACEALRPQLEAILR